MISSFDRYKQVESPDMYLCNPDKRLICAINGEDRHLTLRFNDLSELTFTVPKIKGTENNYNLIETKRLIFVDKIGWFQIENAEETSEGDRSSKNVTALSHQYMFKNRGFVTEERTYMFYNPNDPLDDKYKSKNKSALPSVIGQLNKQLGIKVELNRFDIEPSEDKMDWTIIYIDPILYFRSKSYNAMYEPSDNAENICRGFEADKELNGYDFMVNKVEKAFEVVFEFDFLYHTIKVKTLEDITRPTNIYLSFENVVNSLKVKEDSENIVTVMSCNGGDLNVRSVNPMGTNYLVNFDYYKKRKSDDGELEYPWMSKELIDALDEWEQEFEKWQKDDSERIGHERSYSSLVGELQELYIEKLQSDEKIQYANLKLKDLQAARDQHLSGEVALESSDGYITAETVQIGECSLLSGSGFADSHFEDNVTIRGYPKAPTLKKTENGQYFQFLVSGVTGMPKRFILNFIDSTNTEDNDTIPFYFMDGNNKSYCKLNVKSEVGVVKDSNGNFAKSGSVEIKNVTFKVSSSGGIFSIELPNGETISRSQSNSYFIYNETRYRIVEGADGIVSVYCFFVSGFDRYTIYSEMGGDNGWCSVWENHINFGLIPENDRLQSDIEAIEKEMKYINGQCNIETFIQNRGQKLYDELSDYWVEGNYSNDNIKVFDNTTMSERIELAKELMEVGKKDLEKCAQPQFEMSVDAIDFIRIYEFRQFTKELALGKVVTIEKSEGIYYRPALMTMEYDLDSSDSFSMTFSNASRPGDTAMTFADLIKESASTSRNVTANWSNLTDYTRNKDSITSLIEEPLNRALRSAKKNMAAQAFVIDDTGILGRKYDTDFDGAKGTFSPEQVRIVNNTILFTDDNWTTASLALGKTENGYGLVAGVLVGELILGEKISIGSNSERVTITDQGILIKNESGDAVFEADQDGNVILKGTVYATDGEFKGTVYATGGEFTGKIKAKEGQIGGYTIDETSLTSGNVGMSSDTDKGSIAFWAGGSIAADASFSVTNDGYLKATSGMIGGLKIAADGSLNTDNFSIRNLTRTENGVTRTETTLILSGGGNGTTIDTTSIKTSNITVDNILVDGSLTSLGSLTCGGVSLVGNSIRCNGRTIDFNTGETVNTYTLTLSKNETDGYVKATINSPPVKGITCVFTYETNWGNELKTGYFTFTPGGETEKYHFFSYFWGIKNLKFTKVNEQSVSGGTTATTTVRVGNNISFTGNLLPAQDNTYTLGGGKYRFADIFGMNPSVSTSDAKLKKEIKTINENYSKMFDLLAPRSYKFLDGHRTHIGFVSQEVKTALDECNIDSEDFAGYIAWKNGDGTTGYGLRYGEFIALCVYEIQMLKKRVKELETNNLFTMTDA